MAKFILIHGAWHGAWCWHKVASALRAAGHDAVAIDLPSHGSDATPIADVSLRAYVDRIVETIDAQDATHPQNPDDSSQSPIVLVGHSMGGIPISQAAEYRAEKLHSLVYLTAILPSPGDTTIEPPDLRGLEDFLLPTEDGTAIEFAPEGVRPIFYGDCDDDDVSLALDQLCPQAANIFQSPLELSASKFGSVPRYYIECLKDAALPPAAQRGFYERTPCRKVYPLEASHSPFFSMPGKLADILVEIAGSAR